MRWSVGMTGLATLMIGADLATPLLRGAEAETRPAAIVSAKPKPEDDPAERAMVDELLARWKDQGTRAGPLRIRFTRVDHFSGRKQEARYDGWALLTGTDRLLINLDKVESPPGASIDRREVKSHHERIIGTGDAIYRYAIADKRISVYPLDRPTRRRFLEGGPVPFLHAMPASEVRRRFRVSIIREDTRAYWLRFLPIGGEVEAFSRADLWLDKKTYAPSMLHLVEAGGEDSQTYTFGAAERPGDPSDGTFRATLYPGWTVVQNPGPDGRPLSNAPPRLGRPEPRPTSPAVRLR